MRSTVLHLTLGLMVAVMCLQVGTSAGKAGMSIDYGLDGYTVGEEAKLAKQANGSSPSIRTVKYTVTKGMTDTVRCHAWGWNSDWANIRVYVGLFDSNGTLLVEDVKEQYPVHTVERTVEQTVSAGTYECRADIFIDAFHVTPSVWVNAN